MKIISFTLLIFLTTNIFADKNWIQIESHDKTKIKTQKEKIKVKPIIKQVLYGTKKKNGQISNEKNWFVLKNTDDIK